MNEQNEQFDYEEFKKAYETEDKLLKEISSITHMYKKSHMYSLILTIATSILQIYIIKQMVYTEDSIYQIMFIILSLNIISMIKILIREKEIINSRECRFNALNKQHMIAYEKVIKPNEERNSKNDI